MHVLRSASVALALPPGAEVDATIEIDLPRLRAKMQARAHWNELE